MFPLRRIFQNRKYLTNFIYTSNAISCENSKNTKTEQKNDPELNEEVKIKKKKAAKSIKQKMRKLNPAEVNEVRINFTSNRKEKKVIKIKQEIPEFHNIITERVERKNLEKAAHDVVEELFKTKTADEKVGEQKKEIKSDLINYLKDFQITKDSPKTTEFEYKVTAGPNTTIESVLKDVSNFHIFDSYRNAQLEDTLHLSTWEALEKEELDHMYTTHPNNQFEEHINWTNEGKLWHFPIDNDQGLEEEAKVSFTEHIFLQENLEPWCPKKGPLRRFMDLVLIGLAKNPYLSVEEKKEHIQWFHDYFNSKRKLLQELGAMSSAKEIEDSEEKSSGDAILS